MAEPPLALFPELEQRQARTYTTGVLPAQYIRELITAGRITADVAFTEAQLQPASLDLRLGTTAYRVQASFLPGDRSTVADKLSSLTLAEIDISKPSLLEKGCIYIVPALEQIELPGDVSAYANPRSTTGRLDIFTRLITDYCSKFDDVKAGYRGRLYLEIVPHTFTVLASAGTRLNQIRFVRGKPPETDSIIEALHAEESLVFMGDQSAPAQIDKGLLFSVNLQGDQPGEIVAYKARKNSGVVDLAAVGLYEPDEYWETIFANRRKSLVLDPGDFYILASKEKVRVPPEVAAEMLAFDAKMGEFRIHYAGFFDPGFGYGDDLRGTRAVLEVRAHEVPFVIEDGQVIGRLKYMRLLARPDRIYSPAIGSSYQAQELTLSKQFKRS